MAGVENGNRLVKMILATRSIPYYMKIGGQLCHIIHNDLQPVCRQEAIQEGNVRISSVEDVKIKKAVYSMENDKSPGIDGLTTNFYKHFWPILGDKLTCVCNHAFHTGHLSITQRRGIITLIFKKGDCSLLKNWRPITLLTTDYKIFTKALANRLQRVLPSIILTDQTASIRGTQSMTILLCCMTSYPMQMKAMCPWLS